MAWLDACVKMVASNVTCSYSKVTRKLAVIKSNKDDTKGKKLKQGEN